jgi:hypothetical protein
VPAEDEAEGNTMMKMSQAEVAAEIHGWLCGVQRSMLRQRMEWQIYTMVAGIYSTPSAFINPK